MLFCNPTEVISKDVPLEALCNAPRDDWRRHRIGMSERGLDLWVTAQIDRAFVRMTPVLRPVIAVFAATRVNA